MMQSELRRMRLARLRAIAWQGQEAIERERVPYEKPLARGLKTLFASC